MIVQIVQSTTGLIDRTGWPPGPWDNEPDRVEWRYRGTPRFPLLIVRGPSGALCGYVGLPPGHPYHGVEHWYWTRYDVSCHGGVTFSGSCQENGHICHVPHLGESPDVWWLGFDCAHHGDVCPSPHMFSPAGYEYRDLAYVRREVERLAEQLAKIAKGIPL